MIAIERVTLCASRPRYMSVTRRAASSTSPSSRNAPYRIWTDKTARTVRRQDVARVGWVVVGSGLGLLV
jgi:hypothetical protein